MQATTSWTGIVRKQKQAAWTKNALSEEVTLLAAAIRAALRSRSRIVDKPKTKLRYRKFPGMQPWEAIEPSDRPMLEMRGVIKT